MPTELLEACRKHEPQIAAEYRTHRKPTHCAVVAIARVVEELAKEAK